MNIPRPRIPKLLDDPEYRAIARVYAEAILDSNVDHAELLGDYSSFVVEVLDHNPSFETALTSTVISQREKAGMLERVVKPVSSSAFYNVLCVISGHGRLDLVRLVLDEALLEQDRRQKRRDVKVTSATPLSESQILQLTSSIETKMSFIPRVENEVNPDILGGLIIQVGDSVFDNSLRAQVSQLSGQLRMRYLHEIQSGRDRFSYSEGN